MRWFAAAALACGLFAAAGVQAFDSRQSLHADLRFEPGESRLGEAEQVKIRLLIEEFRARLPAGTTCLDLQVDAETYVIGEMVSRAQLALANRRLATIRQALAAQGMKDIPRPTFGVVQYESAREQDPDTALLDVRFRASDTRSGGGCGWHLSASS